MGLSLTNQTNNLTIKNDRNKKKDQKKDRKKDRKKIYQKNIFKRNTNVGLVNARS